LPGCSDQWTCKVKDCEQNGGRANKAYSFCLQRSFRRKHVKFGVCVECVTMGKHVGVN